MYSICACQLDSSQKGSRKDRSYSKCQDMEVQILRTLYVSFLRADTTVEGTVWDSNSPKTTQMEARVSD